MSDPTTNDPPPPRTEAEIAAAVAKAQAEAAKFQAEARKATLEADKVALEHRLALLEVTEKERKRAAADADDVHHYVYRFNGDVDKASVGSAVSKLTEWHRLAPERQTFEVIFNSPGGLVHDGFVLYDHLRWLSSQGHRIVTGATGMAASMGGVLVQAGDYRWTSAESWYLIHRAAFGARGKSYEIEDEVELVKRIEERIINIFVSRSGGKLTKATIKRKWDRTDWWLNSNELMALGLVDEIRGTLPGTEVA